MAQINYIAKRSLKAGHILNDPYTINTELSRRNRTFRTVGDQQVSLSGNTVTTIHRRDTTFDLQSVISTAVSIPDNADWLEFLDSVASGETFQMDLEGTLEDYIMDGLRPYRVLRVGFDEIFRYSFRVRKL